MADEHLQQGVAARDGQRLRIDFAALKAAQPAVDALEQAAVVFVLVGLRIQRPAAESGDLLRQADALIDGLLAGELGDELPRAPGERFAREAARPGGGGQLVCKIGDHDLLPALAHEREGAVEIQHRVAEGARLAGTDPFKIAGHDDLLMTVMEGCVSARMEFRRACTPVDISILA